MARPCAWRWRATVFVVPHIEEAKKLVATDPVINKNDVPAGHHKYHGSAVLMRVKGGHAKITKKRF